MVLKKDGKKNNLVHVNVRLTNHHLKHLRKICIDMASRDQKMYSISYLIRETLLQAYPPPKDAQLDMFS